MDEHSVLWIIQTNMGVTSDIVGFVDVVRALGNRVVEYSHIPFSSTIEPLPHDGPVLVYGAVTFVLAAQQSGHWHPAVFGEPDAFGYPMWARYYGDLLLNAPGDVEQTTIAEFARTTRDPGEVVFARPAQDNKAFDGQVTTVGDILAKCRLALGGGIDNLDAQSPILVAKPWGIEAEWRLFMSGGAVVAASQYQRGGRTSKVEGAPHDVVEFARRAAAIYSPGEMFVLDVCHSNGRPYIVEAQSFNSAGFYAADQAALASGANQAALRAYASSSRPAAQGSLLDIKV